MMILHVRAGDREENHPVRQFGTAPPAALIFEGPKIKADGTSTPPRAAPSRSRLRPPPHHPPSGKFRRTPDGSGSGTRGPPLPAVFAQSSGCSVAGREREFRLRRRGREEARNPSGRPRRYGSRDTRAFASDAPERQHRKSRDAFDPEAGTVEARRGQERPVTKSLGYEVSRIERRA